MTSAGLKHGTTVGDRYRVERVLGQGELGCSYLCHDLMEADSLVMLRTLTGSGVAGRTDALRQELSFLNGFKHPYLAHLLDFGVIDPGPTPYLVRQYVEGMDIYQGSIDWSVDQILHQLVRLCRVLQCLHFRGIVHCRLKPSNVILTYGDGSDLEPKVLDFGLDRLARRSRLGPATLAYAAPEILLGMQAIPDLTFTRSAFLPINCSHAASCLMTRTKDISSRNISRGRPTCVPLSA